MMSRAARPLCEAAGLACQAASRSRTTGYLAVPDGVPEPLLPRVRTGGSDPSPRLQVQLQLQRDLFTRGGRLAPIDVLVDVAAASPPTERKEKVPAWVTKLRASRGEYEKRRRWWTSIP